MADWENNSQHSDHSGNSLDNNLCLFEDWPAWKQKQHLASCCPICQGPYTYYIFAEDIDDNLEERRECAGCGKRACPECLEGCTSARSIETAHAMGERRAIAMRYPSPCTVKLVEVAGPRRMDCAAPQMATTRRTPRPKGTFTEGGAASVYGRKPRHVVREVERNLLLGAKDRAAPVKDAPKATVVLDRLVRTGQAPMASVVLDFAGGRRDGPRRKAKLRAKKDLTAKVPRKQCALKAQLARLVGGGYVVEKRQVRKFLKY